MERVPLAPGTPFARLRLRSRQTAALPFRRVDGRDGAPGLRALQLRQGPKVESVMGSPVFAGAPVVAVFHLKDGLVLGVAGDAVDDSADQRAHEVGVGIGITRSL